MDSLLPCVRYRNRASYLSCRSHRRDKAEQSWPCMWKPQGHEDAATSLFSIWPQKQPATQEYAKDTPTPSAGLLISYLNSKSCLQLWFHATKLSLSPSSLCAILKVRSRRTTMKQELIHNRQLQ